MGFSDGTALLAFAARAGVASIHGPVVTQLGNLPAGDQRALFERLETPGPSLLLDGLEGLIPGRVRGPLMGGNLEVFSRLVGTPFLPDVSGAILFFEDLGERPYRIDRLLTHLDLAGVFGAASGVIAGDFSGCREPEATRADSPTARTCWWTGWGGCPCRSRCAARSATGRATAPAVRNALRAGHGGGDADRPRRRGRLKQDQLTPRVDPRLVVGEGGVAARGGGEAEAEAADDGAGCVGSMKGGDEGGAREPARTANGGVSLLAERDEAARAADRQDGQPRQRAQAREPARAAREVGAREVRRQLDGVGAAQKPEAHEIACRVRADGGSCAPGAKRTAIPRACSASPSTWQLPR